MISYSFILSSTDSLNDLSITNTSGSSEATFSKSGAIACPTCGKSFRSSGISNWVVGIPIISAPNSCKTLVAATEQATTFTLFSSSAFFSSCLPELPLVHPVKNIAETINTDNTFFNFMIFSPPFLSYDFFS